MERLYEKDLLLQLKNGSSEAFERLFNEHSGKLYNFILKFSSGNKYLAEEIVQRTFIKLWETHSLINPEKNFNSYLCTIAKNMVLFNFRCDGSYIFPAGKRWGFFPGVSLGWRISEEKFIKDNIEILDNLKVRASYGQQGNDNVGAFQYLLKYATGRNYVFGDKDVQGVYQDGFPNKDITCPKGDIEKGNNSDFTFRIIPVKDKIIINCSTN